MRFKVIQESTTFKKLREIETKISEVKKKANKLCKKLGGLSVATTGRNAAGGIDDGLPAGVLQPPTSKV